LADFKPTSYQKENCMPIPRDMINEGQPGCFKSPEWAAKNAVEIASRPQAMPTPGPLTPAVLDLYRQRGAAFRAVGAARDAATKQAAQVELTRINELIVTAERERRAAALKRS
jgi:hypothetical protein